MCPQFGIQIYTKTGVKRFMATHGLDKKRKVFTMANVKVDIIISIKQCIENYFDTYNSSPSVREISASTGVSKSTVQRYLDAMERAGIISKSDLGFETPYISKTEREMVSVAKIGTIPCGPLDDREEYIDGYVRLPKSFVGKGSFFILTADGNSMIDAGIDDGDMVIIRKQDYARRGDIVVALADGQSTLKRYYPEPENKRVVLHPENEEMDDIIVSNCLIQGVATKVIKSL